MLNFWAKVFFSVILTCLSYGVVLAQNTNIDKVLDSLEAEKNYDSMIVILKEFYYHSNSSDQQKNKYLERLVLSYLDNGDNLNGSAFASKLVRSLEKNKALTLQLSKAYAYKTEAELKLKNLESANRYARKGYAIDLKLKDTARIVKGFIRLGIICHQDNRNEEALTYYYEAKKIKTNDQLLNYYLYNALTVVFNSMNQYDSSLYYGKKTLESSKKLMPLVDSQIVLALCNLANQFSQLDQFKTALLYLDSTRYYKSKPLPRELFNNIYFNYYIAYFCLKRYDSGHYYLNKYIDNNNEIQEANMQTEITEFEEMTKKEKTYLAKNQDAKIELLNLQIIILMVAIALLSAIGVIAYYIYFNTKRKAKISRDKIIIEQLLLRSQMNPHFIFNTLSNIQTLVEDKAQSATKYLTHFTNLMETTLKNSTENFISIERELRSLEEYLSLQSMRFEGEFDYTLEENVQNKNLLIPPMILQPFVENAIHHGIRNLDRKGKISITIKTVHNAIECSVDDNGRGLTVSTNTSKTKQSLSTQIVRQRLEILKMESKRDANVTIFDKKENGGCGVKVTVTLPLISDEKKTTTLIQRTRPNTPISTPAC